ncbi:MULTISPECIES: tellurite resistance/C4-dicarboxylate transporter family protein [Modicisalibacter]|uniref:Tellurite resistance/C4-dicarboxylate transporter family protein n=1 Tax=Modicisalibacter tunisiensis TaxID=390637 RepID=A0ABS7WXB1_9GAMM|nr:MULTISPECIES: tellurite resistance/C4-dicarboxylate transporter family protein [Modicisalibacter]MBZ9566769.1 tellurite resistance/C4-dicarboxylate transporter family protein [Modicisalibacter tunisiensis]
MTRLARLIDRTAADFFPGYFAVAMATGTLSIAAHLLRIEAMARAFFYINCAAYLVLFGLLLVRIIRHPHRLIADMHSHSRGPGFFTLIPGTCILGAQMQLIAHSPLMADLLLGLGMLLWVGVMYWFFIAVIVHPRKPSLRNGINGSWLLASVATHSLAILCTLIDWPSAWQTLALLAALCLFLVGGMLYLVIIPIIFYRLTFVALDVTLLSPPYWINMGAMAIATLSGAGLMLTLPTVPALSDFLPFIRGITLFMWASATWWIPLLLGLSAWRYLIARHPLRYDPQYWSIVFPIAMYTAATARLGEALAIPALLVLPHLSLWAALAVWVGTAIGMLTARRNQPVQGSSKADD